MSATLASVVDAMKAYLAAGIREGPDGTNEIGRRYGFDKVSWCAETVSMAQFDAAGTFVFKTASVDAAIQAAKAGKNGLRWIPRNQASEVRAGHFSTFDWKLTTNPGHWENYHISCVVDPGTLVTKGLSGKFETIGGNEDDQVKRQWRDCTFVQGWIALPWPATDEGDLGMAIGEEIQRHLSEMNDFLAKRMSEMLTDLQRRDDQNKKAIDDMQKRLAAIEAKIH